MKTKNQLKKELFEQRIRAIEAENLLDSASNLLNRAIEFGKISQAETRYAEKSYTRLRIQLIDAGITPCV